MLVIESEAEQDVRVFELSQVGPLQQFLVFLNGPADLSLFAIEVPENEVNLERVSGGFCGGYSPSTGSSAKAPHMEMSREMAEINTIFFIGRFFEGIDYLHEGSYYRKNLKGF